VPSVQWKTPDDGQRHCPKHVEFRTKIYLEISASVGFIVRKFDTMHGHMNVKKKVLAYQEELWSMKPGMHS
jgi:hypothetical protein